MNTRRNALSLAAVLAATVLTGGAAILGITHTAQAPAGRARRRSFRRPAAGAAMRRKTDAAHLDRRPLRLGDARDRRGARLVASAAAGTTPQAAAQTLVVKTVNGKRQLVVVQPPLSARRTRRPRPPRCRDDRPLERIAFRAVGTDCSAAVTARRRRPTACAARPRRRARRGRRLRAALSRFDPSSDLSQLNRDAGSWVAVDERLLEALRLALRARVGDRRPFRPDDSPGARRRGIRPLVRAARGASAATA